ncbi:MupA/Atu3671 family FMN-dependent luciferase-like monooxygenase [Marivita sp. S0852]|uniref:MupA/Atu3671 family FMN-dependent luciferase-like monooxygenase n=1 Tax=Marivita sp. S0852 TaxID=3373893 RepID=UPI00398229F4
MTVFDSILIGDESLTQHCAETLLAHGHGISVFVTDNASIRDWARARNIRVEPHGPDLGARLSGASVDWILSIANLKLLPSNVLRCAREGVVNFHDGPLPRHAGLNAPVWALLEGETRHGITWHLVQEGIDTGDILVQRSFDISGEDTALTLNTKCYEAGVLSFPDLLNELSSKAPNRRVQDSLKRTYHALADRPDANGILCFDRSAQDALRLIRAMDHGPYWNPLSTAKLWTENGVIHVGQAQSVTSNAAPGTVIDVDDQSVTVAFSDAALKLSNLKASDTTPLDPSRHMSLGQVLPNLSSDTRKTLSDVIKSTAPKDAYWRTVLANFTPLGLPFLSKGHVNIERVETDISGDFLVPALAVLADRLSGDHRTMVAFSDNSLSAGADLGVILPWVPVSLSPHQSTMPDIPSGIASDIAVRDPEMRAPSAPALGLSNGAGPIPGVALTLENDCDRVIAHIDTGQLTSTFADVLIRRLRWIADQLSDRKPPQDVDHLPPGERRDVIEGFNQTRAQYDPDQTMHAAFEAQVAQTPDAVALVHETSQITYASLNDHANRIAHSLRDMGVGPDTIVGLHCARDPDLIAGALGILKAGGAYLPLDPDYPADRLSHYLSDSKAPIVLTQRNLLDDLPRTTASVLVIDEEPRLANADCTNPVSHTTQDHLAYVIYTSGSTGVPKGVMIEHRNVLNFYTGMDAVVPDRKDAAWLAVTSLSFDISVLELFYTMARGIKVVLPSTSQRGVISGGAARTASNGMDFSIYYWGNDDGVGRDKYKLLLEGAKFADENGFCAVWTPERHFHAFGGPYPNPSVTGAAVAGVTKQIGVRAGSCVAPLHHPARIAEEWAVIDNLTNGRAGLAIASGWQPDDFVLRPENTPPDNKPAMFDAIDQVRKLWRGEPVAFPRKDGQMHEVVTQPRPVSKELPIWVTTAGNPDTWREAGLNGAHVLTHLLGQSIDEVAEKIGLYRRALRDAGHNPEEFQVTLMLHTFLAQTREEAREIAREPMKDYLRSAAGLIKQYAWAFPAFKKPEGVKNAFDLNLGDLSEDDLEGILDFAFERYFNESGLFGTPQDALDRVDQLKAIGVSEIACLIDYGISTDQVLEGLKPLAEVVRKSAPRSEHEDQDHSIAAMLSRYKVTHLQCTPSMARMIAMDDDARAQLKGLKHIFLGGEPLPGALVAELQTATPAKITNMYGPTETTIWSSTEQAQPDETTVNIGSPIANTQLYVLDDALAPLGIGEEGELWIGGDGLTRGYCNHQALTDDRYRANPFASGRMYRTGDLVQRRPDGKLNFLGRTDQQVKLRGFRIELGEIESNMQAFPGITNAVVLAREDTPGDVRLVGYLTKNKDIDPQALRAHLSDHLPDYMIPAHYVTLDRFPVTPNQKIDRKALPAPTKALTRSPRPAIVSVPRDGSKADANLQARIARIWTEVLGIGKIGPDDNFFDLGGHSLLAVQTHRLLRDRLEIAGLSITDIFQFPKLEALADRIAGLGGAHVSAGPQTKAAPSQDATDRAQQRANAMSRRREMRARRKAS